jgi:oligopeptide transport system substrate-binding protein
MMRNVFRWSLLLGLLAGGQAFARTRVAQGNREGILHLGNGTELESLDPHLTTGVPEFNVISALMEGLILEDPETLEPTPGVAERWTVSDDGLVYRFYFRENARWSNGDPVTADDFVYSFRRMLSPQLGAEYAYMLHVIQNARAYNSGELEDVEAVGVKAEDPRTLVVTLEKPAAFFIRMLNHHAFYPVHPPTVEAHGGPHDRTNRWARPGSYVGNGPFMLESWQLNQSLRVVKNPHYWNAAAVRLNGIVFYPIEDQQTEERMFRSGGLHKTEGIPLARIERHRNDPAFVSHPYLATYYFLINTTREPFNDVRVRQALALSLRRQDLTERVLRAGEVPALWFTPKGTADFEPSQRLEENIEDARRLLAEAGFPGGRGFPRVSLLYNTRESHRLIAQVVQQMWRENLGIEIELVNQEWQVYMVSRRNLDFDLARAGWAGDYPDPHNFLDLHLSTSGNNHTGWSDPEYDELIHRATGIQNTEERFALYDKAEAILLRDMPFIPLYWYTRTYLKHPSVRGLTPNVLARRDYTAIWLEE